MAGLLPGGTAESVQKAAENTQLRHPALQLVGAYSPRSSRCWKWTTTTSFVASPGAPHLLFVAFGCRSGKSGSTCIIAAWEFRQRRRGGDH